MDTMHHFNDIEEFLKRHHTYETLLLIRWKYESSPKPSGSKQSRSRASQKMQANAIPGEALSLNLDPWLVKFNLSLMSELPSVAEA